MRRKYFPLDQVLENGAKIQGEYIIEDGYMI